MISRFCICHSFPPQSYCSTQQSRYRTQAGIIIKCFFPTLLRILIVFGVLMFLGFVVPSKIVNVITRTDNESLKPYYFHTEEMYQYQSGKFPRNGNSIPVGQEKQDSYNSLETAIVSDEDTEKQKFSFPTTRKKHGSKKPIGFDYSEGKRKFWLRISDDVFVYSAHVDTRNVNVTIILNPPLNNISSGASDGRVKNDPKREQRPAKNVDDDDDDDSDKLKHVILVRIVGMKAIPSLREFIKTDVLDWFRIKNEMEYSQKYKCNLFFSASTGTPLQNVTSSRVTYTVVEEGVKIYASTYFNCYFAVTPFVYRSIKWSALFDNLQVAMYPTTVTDYPTKLIDVGSLMIDSENEKNNGSSNDINFRPRSLSICVRPLFGPFDDLEKLVQFIGYYHVVGITRFNFYFMSVSPRVRKYMARVMGMMREVTSEEGQTLPRFTLHEWNVPTGNTSELWDYGTLAALNDCLFSNVDQEFVVFVDIDEFIVPQMNDTSINGDDNNNNPHHHRHPTLWSIIDSHNTTKTYQYLIRNTFFCHEFCDKGGNYSKSYEKSRLPSSSSNIQASLPVHNSSPKSLAEPSIFRCFQRTKRVWTAALRSKFIVNPREVLSVGHHLATKYIKKTDFRFSSHSVQVDPKVGILNHYRECTSISSQKHPVVSRVRETDKTIINFRQGVIDVLRRYYSSQLVI